MALTKRQREILDYIAEFIRTKRYSPSLEEIASHFDLSSVATVHKHVANLEKKGFIRRSWNRSRSIDVVTSELPPVPVRPGTLAHAAALQAGAAKAMGRVADGALPAQLPGAVSVLRGGFEPDPGAGAADDPDIVRLPLAGRVAAGRPIEAVLDRETIAVPAPMVGRGRSYVLQVAGSSMIGEHIQDGDYVIVEERSEARDGEKVIAVLADGEATLKTFRRHADGSVLLEPANPAFETLRVRDGEFHVRGVVIGVMRKYRR